MLGAEGGPTLRVFLDGPVRSPHLSRPAAAAAIAYYVSVAAPAASADGPEGVTVKIKIR